MASPKKIDTNKVIKCYYCGEIIKDTKNHVIKQVPMQTKGGTRRYNRQLHIDCMLKYNKELENEELKKEENDDWDLVYQYFKKDLLGMRESSKLDDHSVRRLLGLRLGQYYPSGNNTRILKRGYEFKTILLAMKVVKPKVSSYMSTANFKDSKHKTNTVMRFIADEIEDVAQRLEKNEKAKAKLEQDTVKDNFDYASRLNDKQPPKENNTKNDINALFGGM